MRLIGLAVILALSLALAPLAGEAQQAGKVYRIGWLGSFPLEVQMKARSASVVTWGDPASCTRAD
jgi:hypothetical protein